LTIPGSNDAVRHPNGSPALARRIAQAVLLFGALLAMIKFVEYATLHAAIYTAIYAAVHWALNLSE